VIDVPSLQLFVGAEFFCLNISWKSYLFLNMLELPDVEKIKRDEVMGIGVKIRHVYSSASSNVTQKRERFLKSLKSDRYRARFKTSVVKA
jgi:hypothetical protein